jgi:hypothetical protein
MSSARTPRSLALLLAVGLLAAASAALAQDGATPTADGATPAAGQATPAAGDPAVGQEVRYLDEAGAELAVVTVVAVTDDFTEFDENFTPDEGVRYVAAEITVRSTGDGLDVNPADFALHTADGFLSFGTFVLRPNDATPPTMERTVLDAGASVSGLVFFEVPADAAPTRLVWQPDRDRLLVLADLRAQAAP